MRDFIQINGRQIELTEEQAKELAEVYGAKPTALSEIPVGGTFFVAGEKFVVLEHTELGTAAILKGLLKDSRFGDNNNFAKSEVLEVCRVFAESLEEGIDPPILMGHEVDLTSDDGLKDYGVATCRCSLLTADLYRRYVDVLDLYKVDRWWWLATPYSTPRHEDDSWVKCVAPSGHVRNGIYGGVNGVRPFCIFNSSIFVS